MLRRPSGAQLSGVLFLSGFLAGCSTNPAKQSRQSVTPVTEAISLDQQCDLLGEIFNKSINGFRSIREQPCYLNKATRWEARYHLIDNSCEIWQWSDKYSYICSRVVYDKDMVDNLFDEAGRLINHCLNDSHIQWKQQQTVLEKQGVETSYSINGLLRGTLRKVNTGGLFSDSWTVYFRVDSPNMY